MSLLDEIRLAQRDAGEAVVIARLEKTCLSIYPEGRAHALNTPRFQGHPTNKEWDLYDVQDSRDPRPPQGASLLTLNEGGVLTIGPWRKGLRYWGYKPGVPKEPIPPEFQMEGV